MGIVKDKKKQKASNILHSAYAVFVKKGFESTSISDITRAAGVAKGTFYLYYKDKNDVLNRLIAHTSSELFRDAYQEMQKQEIPEFEDKVIFIINHLIDALKNNHELLRVVSKNLSWGIFRSALEKGSGEEDIDFLEFYRDMVEMNSSVRLKDPEIMLFMIVELASSTCYSTILDNDPVDFESIRPYLNKNIRSIIYNHRI